MRGVLVASRKVAKLEMFKNYRFKIVLITKNIYSDTTQRSESEKLILNNIQTFLTVSLSFVKIPSLNKNMRDLRFRL